MTPAEHYAEAERLLTELADWVHVPLPDLNDEERAQAHVVATLTATQVAQVHATLATVDPDVAATQPIPKGCSCSRMAHPPHAIVSQDLGCPVHGIPG